MTLSDIASIGGFISSIAVCGSLIYLALQVRQSDRNQRSQMVQGISGRGANIVMFLAQPHISVLLWRGMRPTFPAEMARVVDGLMDGLPLTAPVDLPAILKHGLAQLRAQDKP